MSEMVDATEQAPPVAAMASPQDMAREQFMKHFDDFMKALSEVFPDDDSLRDYYLKYRIGVVMMSDPAQKKINETMIIEKFRNEASDKFDRLVARDVTVVKELTFIDWFAPVFERADEDTRSTIFEYCDLLIQHCVCYDMYTKIPPNVSSALGSITESVERGAVDPTKLDVANLSAQILQNVNPVEMQEFALKMMSDEVAMKNLCRIAAGQMQKNAAPAVGAVGDAADSKPEAAPPT
jgi:hypothetical protein